MDDLDRNEGAQGKYGVESFNVHGLEADIGVLAVHRRRHSEYTLQLFIRDCRSRCKTSTDPKHELNLDELSFDELSLQSRTFPLAP